MKRYEKEAVAEFKTICQNAGFEPYQVFEIYGYEVPENQRNNIIGNLRSLCTRLLKRYTVWNVGLKFDLNDYKKGDLEFLTRV